MTPIPTDGKEHAVSRKPAKQPVSLREAASAAKEAGFDVVDASKLQAAGLVGRFVAETGAIDIGRARLAVNIERADKMIGVIAEEASTSGDPEIKLGLLKVAADLIGKSNSAAEMLIKSAQTAAATALAEKEMAVPAFGPGRPAALTQVNVSVSRSDGSVEIKKKEVPCQQSEESSESTEE